MKTNNAYHKHIFCITDVHGHLTALKNILRNWNPKTHVLVGLGDYVDRGPQSIETLLYLRALQDTHGKDNVILLRGNHDDAFLKAMYDDEGNDGYGDKYRTGYETMVNLRKVYPNITETTSRKTIRETASEVFDFIKSMPLYFEYGRVLCTHAGFQSMHSDWRKSRDIDFTDIRNHWRKPNRTNRVNVFGHTPTHHIHKITHQPADDIWISPCGKYIGIDGGYAFGGAMHGVVINAHGHLITSYTTHSSMDYPQHVTHTQQTAISAG